MLPKVCQHFDHGNTNQITCGDFRKTLENLGINLSQKEMMEVLNFADKEHTGHVRYRWFAKVLTSLDSWEKTFPQRLGAELGCPPRNANLGQGVQVLVDVKQKTSLINKGFQKSSPYDLLTGEANEDIQATGFLREPKYSSYAERAAALSKHKHEFGIIEQIYCPPQWSSDKSTRVCPEIPLELNARLTEHAEKCPEEENAINSQEDGVRCAPTQGASHAVSVAAEYLALQPKPEETITKREDIRSPKKSRQMAMAPYRAANSITMEANLHSISPPRILKTRHIVSMPFKERIHKEQHSEDLYAVQILS
ncbi:hypothetical protein KP509_1Z089700 [Ceratopteris richardii]|nr:hypothetical protein KP509_1Z089700 [Ceratopteris richardii]